MKKIIGLIFAFVLASCGTIGIGSNHETNIYNNSDSVINVKADSGVYKIEPKSSMVVTSKNNVEIISKDKSCASTFVKKIPNSLAITLDWFPGIFALGIPAIIDECANNLDKMPKSYSYSCIEK